MWRGCLLFRRRRYAVHHAPRWALLALAFAWPGAGRIACAESAVEIVATPTPVGRGQVIDMAGRRVALPERLDRLASVGGSPAVNAFLFLFGLQDRLVNGLPTVFHGDAWRWQRRIAPKLTTLPVVSGPPPAWAPQIETLLVLKPDLSFVVDIEAARQLQRAALPAVVLNWSTPSSIRQTVTLLGQITGDTQRSQDYFAWESRLQEQVSHCKAMAKEAPPRVLYFRYGNLSQPIMVPANRLIAQAGGASVTANDNPLQLDVFPFSLEQLLTWQPDVMLLAFAEELPALLADPRLADIPAVRNRRVFAVPHGIHIWTHYTPEQPLGILWLARLLHRDSCGDLPVAAESREFYRRFFGIELTEDELRKLLGSEAIP